eukprot:535005_1
MLHNGFVFLALCIWTFLPIHYSISNINCIDVKSSLMNSTNGIATAVCSSPYTLLSCGFETGSPTSLSCCGSYISGSTCHARDKGSTGGVYAVAHCCDLTAYSVSCNTYQSPISSGVDDARTTASCQSNEVLMGCTAMTPGSYLDGGYPGTYRHTEAITLDPVPNICTGWDGGESVYSYATCCKAQNFNKITFECIAIISDYAPASTGSGATVSVNCPQDYFMTSCFAGGAWKNMNQWTISSDTCTARNQRTGSGYSVTGNAVAICCKILTLSPTTYPTTIPSNSPSVDPSNDPTKYPTEFPTKYPSKYPSNYPTIQPTTNPSNNPTSQPTTNPTNYPTIEPTVYPTFYPTIEPTFFPTKNPTKVTNNPSTN